MLLSTEVGGGPTDTVPMGIASANGYDFAGLDSAADRSTGVRDVLSYYRGAPATPWPIGDRRRLIVLNGVADSASHAQWKILHNEQFSNGASVQAIINSVMPAAPAGLSFETWTTENSLTSGQDGATDDPDLDGSANLLEFSAGTNPLDRALVPSFTLEKAETGFTFSYERLIDATGI
ncbi:hypothetical protein N9Z50_04600, partial [Akkermansiaceae bacterium]|nr:hypothetical protein [Akkermansiaceae bacterium]